ncbi:hypothetical protein [Streptomyces sp. V4I8]|uniref:hypothetical protein n=1 Tax=Streptomyces sp. V4I8 TaxID=3156469 RepID=UPI003514C26B
MEGWKFWWGVAAFFLALQTMEGWKFWWGVAAFFIAGLATQVSGWLAHRRRRAETAAEAAAAAEQRRVDFELQNLIETNMKLHAYREQLFCFVAAAREVREAQAQNRPSPEGELRAANETLEAAEGALHTNVGLILDDVVRDRVWRAMEAIDLAVTEAVKQDEVDFRSVGSVVNEACDALSSRVRNLYATQPMA